MSDSVERQAGKRVLLVEDETLVAMLLTDMLVELGCEVVGPARRVADALSLVETERLDAAVLDVNVAGEQVFPVADRLAELGVPFVFSTGYSLQANYATQRVLQKPYERHQLASALSASLS